MPRVSWLDWSSTSAGWVVLLCQSNEGAWRRFMEKRCPGIVTIATRQGLSPADAERLAGDLTSKLWIRMGEGKFGYDERKSFNGYVIEMARNMAIDVMRAQGRQPQVLIDDGTLVVEREWDAQDDRRWGALQKALKILREETPKDFLIWSRRNEGRSVAEVCEEFGVKPGAVYSACYRVNTRLAKVAHDQLVNDSDSM